MITVDVFFSHQDPASPVSHVIADRNMSEHQMWLTLIDHDTHDADSLIIELMRLTGMNRTEVNNGLNAVAAMDNLPGLRALQEKHYPLSVAFVSRIMTAVARAGEELWDELDRRIVERLTPQVANEVMIQAHDLAGLITRWIKELDPAFGKEPAAEPGALQEYLTVRFDNGMAHIRGRINPTDGHHLAEALSKVRKEGMTDVDALRALLDSEAPVKIIQNIYTPQNGGLSWMPGVGYFDWDCQGASRVVDLDCHANTVEKGYRPSEGLANHVRARDGHCRMPGCRVPADQCQIDHIIPWGEGGLTVAWNLQCLCQHHHNMKTDGRFRADINAVGEVTWIGPMNQPMVTTPMGPLAPVMPTGTWGQTLRSRMEARFKRIRAAALEKFNEGRG